MATVTHVFTVDYVAQMLGEHPDLIQAIISNAYFRSSGHPFR